MRLKSVSLPVNIIEIPNSTEIVSAFKDLLQKVNSTLRRFSGIFFSFISALKERRLNRKTFSSSDGSTSGRSKFPFNKIPKPGKKILVLTIAVIGILGLMSIFRRDTNTGTTVSGKIEVKPAKATFDLNKELNFPLRNSKGEEISKITYVLEKAELRDEIIVDGKRATAIKDRTFLIVTIKIVNNYDQSIQINSKDYVRLSVNGNKEEWLAPDIHNDPVEVQAIATKYTRLGFPINDTDKDLILAIGEIQGDKEEVPLNF